MLRTRLKLMTSRSRMATVLQKLTQLPMYQSNLLRPWTIGKTARFRRGSPRLARLRSRRTIRAETLSTAAWLLQTQANRISRPSRLTTFARRTQAITSTTVSTRTMSATARSNSTSSSRMHKWASVTTTSPWNRAATRSPASPTCNRASKCRSGTRSSTGWTSR